MKELSIDQLLQQASDKLDIEIDWLRHISPEEVMYLLDRCPFLQMVSLNPSMQTQSLQFVEADTGWMVHNYGDALSSSPGRFLLGGGDYRIVLDGEDDEGGGGINLGKGTIRRQAFDTAAFMIALAIELGWEGIHLVDGHPIMMRAAWIVSQQQGIKLSGFEPSDYDKRISRLINRSEVEVERLRRRLQL